MGGAAEVCVPLDSSGLDLYCWRAPLATEVCLSVLSSGE